MSTSTQKKNPNNFIRVYGMDDLTTHLKNHKFSDIMIDELREYDSEFDNFCNKVAAGKFPARYVWDDTSLTMARRAILRKSGVHGRYFEAMLSKF